MLVRIWNNGNGKAVPGDIEDRQADAVEADGPLFDNEGGEGFGKFDAILPAALALCITGTGPGRVDVALDDVPVQAAAHLHTPFEIDEVTQFPGIQGGFVKRFLDSGYPVSVPVHFFDRKTNPGMGNALVYRKSGREGRADPECFIRA